jgi:myo-inositol-1(or 4)-monophosphatase
MAAAAAELAGVTAGCFDVYFEPKLDMWDTRAGTLLVEEAGGEVTHLPAVDSVAGDVVIASNRPLHDRFLSFLSENRGTH